MADATKPVKVRHHFARAVRFSPAALKREMGAVEGVNAKLGVLVTKGVGTMACAYLFCVIALLSLPATLIHAGVIPASAVPHFLASEGLIGMVSWIAQTFIQLVLLSIIMVGQSVQSLAADARAENTFKDTETILDALNTQTAGGLKEVLDGINQLADRLPPKA